MLKCDIAAFLESFHSYSVDYNSDETVPQDVVDRLKDVVNEVRMFTPSTNKMESTRQLINLANKLSDILTMVDFRGRISPNQLEFIEIATAQVDLISGHLILLNDVGYFERMANKFNEVKTFVSQNEKTFESLTREADAQLEYSEFEKSTLKQGVNVSYDMIKGIDKTVDVFKRFVNTANIGAITKSSIIYLVGPPGTGKSTMAMAAVTKFSGGAYYNFDITNLSSSEIGVAEKGVTNIFNKSAKSQKPTTIVFDEIDSILNSDAPHMKSLSTAIQLKLSGGVEDEIPKNIIVIGITNHYSRLSDAMKRRQTIRIFVDLPIPDDVFSNNNNEMSVYKFYISLIFPSQLWNFLRIETFAQQFAKSRFYTDRYTNANIKSIYINIVTFVNTKEGLQRLFIEQQNERLYFTASDLFSLKGDLKAQTDDLLPGEYIPSDRTVLPSREDLINAFTSVKPMTEEQYIDNLVESEEISEDVGNYRKDLWLNNQIKIVNGQYFKISNPINFNNIKHSKNFQTTAAKINPKDDDFSMAIN